MGDNCDAHATVSCPPSEEYMYMVCKVGFLCWIYLQNDLVSRFDLKGEVNAEKRCKTNFANLLMQGICSVMDWFDLSYAKGGSFKQDLGLFIEMDMEPNMVKLVNMLVA